MRPNTIRRCLNSRTITSTARSAKAASRTSLIVGALVLFAPPTIGCGFSPPDESAEITLPLGGGVNQTIQLSLYKTKMPDSSKTKSTCFAYAEIPLSAFPSTSNRFGTSELASAIREQVDIWEVEECSVTLFYDNDTRVELAEHELCISGRYGFEKGGFWSSDRESFCWEPTESESIDTEIEIAQE